MVTWRGRIDMGPAYAGSATYSACGPVAGGGTSNNRNNYTMRFGNAPAERP
jgi:hypothetical protein